jgi:hypothetical protein
MAMLAALYELGWIVLDATLTMLYWSTRWLRRKRR